MKSFTGAVFARRAVVLLMLALGSLAVVRPDTASAQAVVTINTDKSNFTFQGDTTYFIVGTNNLSGTITFEAGAVLKYERNAQLNIGSGTQFNWLGTAYHPVVLTAKDDNSVGGNITRGNPTGYYARIALNFLSPFSPATIMNFRISYAQLGIQVSNGGLNLYDGQFVNGMSGVFVGLATLNMRNLLLANMQNSLTLNDADVNAQQVTFGGSTNYGASFIQGQVAQWNAYLRNCIVANMANGMVVGNWGEGDLTGNNNGFYNNYLNDPHNPYTWNTNTFAPSSNPFAAKGAGYFYLAQNSDGSDASGLRNLGLATTDGTLANELPSKTTCVPQDPPGSNPAGTLFTNRVVRGNPATPDLGYHYDALDYLVSQYTVTGAPTTLTNVSVAVYGTTGFVMQNAYGGFFSYGLVNQMNHLCWYPSVQEQSVLLGNSSPINGSLFNINQTPGPVKIIKLNYTDVSMQGARQVFWTAGASYNGPALTMTSCQLRGVSLGVSSYYASPALPVASVTLQNNLLERCTVSLFNGWSTYSTGIIQNPLAVTLYNNLFWSNTVSLTYMESQDQYKMPWTIHDNLFDGTSLTFSGDGNYLAHVSHSANATNNCAVSGSLFGPGDVSLTALTYANGPLGTRYIASSTPSLVDAGSRPATTAGLAGSTILASQARDNGTVDIGFHYAEGFVKWTFQGACGGLVLASPAIGSGGLVFYADDCNLYGIDPNTHQLAASWTAPVPLLPSGELPSSPTIGLNGSVYIGTSTAGFAACELISVQPQTGVINWTYTDSTLVGTISSTPAIDSAGRIYFGQDDQPVNDNAVLYSLTDQGGGATLNAGWPLQRIFNGSPEESNRSAAVGANGNIYFDTDYGDVYALDTNGNVLWTTTIPQSTYYLAYLSSPSIGSDGTVYVAGGANGSLYALNGSTGAIKWTFTPPNVNGSFDYAGSTPTIGPDGTLYLGTYENVLYALKDLNNTYQVVWSYAFPDPQQSYAIMGSPAIGDDGTVYVASASTDFGFPDGFLFAMPSDASAANGPLWKVHLPLVISGPIDVLQGPSPTIAADGTVYIGGADGALYAIAGGPGPSHNAPWPLWRKNIKNQANSSLP